MTESTLILSVIGMIGLFSTAVIYQRSNRITSRYYRSTLINQDLIKLNNRMFK